MIFKKLLWMIGFFVAFGVFTTLCYMVINPIIETFLRESQGMSLTICRTLGFMMVLYATYLNKVRNDTKRREYLIATRRRYGNFKTNAMYILKSKDFQMEAVAFAIGLNFWMIRTLPQAIEQEGLQGRFGLVVVILLLMELVFAGVFTGIDLLLHNAVHIHWIGALTVSDDPEHSPEQERKKREQNTLYRRGVIEFGLAALILLFYFIDRYAVAFPLMVTPPLFLFSVIYSVMGIREQKEKNRPIRSFVWLHSLAMAVYLVALLFGIFAPK